MLLSGSAARPAAASGYRFAGVLVDVSRARLLVDEVEVAAGALPLKLLRVVCEADGALVSRQDLFDRIWPRQVVSDEALSKLVGRTRELLGPYAAALVTVRGQGVRLDARVAVQLDLPTATSVAPPHPEPVAPSAAGVPAQRPRWWRSALFCLGIVVMLGLAASFWQSQRDPLVYPGYAMHASDLQASKPDTPALIGAAFKAEANGEMVHARTMMRSAHEADPATPVPAIMLAWWEANASADARRWIASARARLRPDSSAYLRLLVDYFDARSADGDVRGPINALLDLRPQAWVLQFARAHDQMGNREFAGALRSLQQIPLDIPDAEQVADALADRVSLGDAAAAAAVTPAIRGDAVLDACLQGRFANSRAALAEAIAAYDRCRDAATPRRDYIHARDAAVFAAMAALEAGAADAMQRVDGAARLCHEQNVQTCEAEMLSLRAFLEARDGRVDAAGASLREAWQRVNWDWAKPPLVLIALENGVPPPADPAEVAQHIPGDTVFGGVADLLLAWREFARGDRQAAQRGLDRAREHGIAQTWHAEDAALLGARLGQPRTACRVDPPYPNPARLSACVALRVPQNR